MRVVEGNAALAQQAKHKLEVLQFLNGDRVQLADTVMQVGVLFEIEGGRRRLAFELRVIDKHLRQVCQHARKPVGRDLFSEKQHE